jgi:hypothetical protein
MIEKLLRLGKTPIELEVGHLVRGRTVPGLCSSGTMDAGSHSSSAPTGAAHNATASMTRYRHFQRKECRFIIAPLLLLHTPCGSTPAALRTGPPGAHRPVEVFGILRSFPRKRIHGSFVTNGNNGPSAASSAIAAAQAPHTFGCSAPLPQPLSAFKP